MSHSKKRCTNSKCRREFTVLNAATLWKGRVVCPYCGRIYPRITRVCRWPDAAHSRRIGGSAGVLQRNPAYKY